MISPDLLFTDVVDTDCLVNLGVAYWSEGVSKNKSRLMYLLDVFSWPRKCFRPFMTSLAY